MIGLIITSSKQIDLNLFIDLAQRVGLSVKPLTNEELLDICLLKAMDVGRKSNFVPKERIMKKLARNGSEVSVKV